MCMRGPNGCNMRCCLLVCLRGCRCVEISFRQPDKALRPATLFIHFYIPPKSPFGKGGLGQRAELFDGWFCLEVRSLVRGPNFVQKVGRGVCFIGANCYLYGTKNLKR